ncbi:MAG TPA: hypothetical protein VEK37_15845 [Gemmatimonadaceae bacterium]|nr:hypothetical protein [Gemmatimonadaceae bacterium]
MAITYTISSEERLINARATGMIRASDLHPFLDALLADPALVPGLRGLYDARLAEPDITILQLAEVAAKVRQLINRGLGRIAIVAQSQATYRVSKTFTVLARALGIDVDVFWELEEAEAYLEEANGEPNTDERPLPR